MSGDGTTTASWQIHYVLTTKLLRRLRDRPAENLTTKRQGDLVAAIVTPRPAPERAEAAAEMFVACKIHGASYFLVWPSDLADALNFSYFARRFLLWRYASVGPTGEIDFGEVDLGRRC
jgi:hypothetical protein